MFLSDEPKSKSQLTILNDPSPNMSEGLRFRQERHQTQNDHLKVAYRSLLPNDIYKQYYSSKSFKAFKSIIKLITVI